MNPSFTPHPGHSNPLYESVRNLDRALARPLRRQALVPLHAKQLLQQVEKFYQAAWQQQNNFLADTLEPEIVELKTLLAAGCRLSSDLNETVFTQLIDQAQSQDAHIAELSRALAQHLMARAQTGQLLKKAQTLRQHGVETAETVGLGIII